MKLTAKQKKFADYYITSGNATESALKAGYSKRTSAEMGYENLNKPHIADYIKQINDKLASERIADMQEVKELWTNIMRGKKEGIEIKDILKASELIAKTNGAFIEKVEHSGEVGMPQILIGKDKKDEDKED